jgi:isoquinoline 1-oxidoreductase alpha subunit
MQVSLKINQKTYDVDADPAMPVLWLLRDQLHLTGTKFGCGAALCGACTIHLNGAPARACQTTVEQAQHQEITTIEGIHSKEAKAIQDAWVKFDVVQCGWCQSGQMMTATHLLANNPHPTEKDIDEGMSANLCRCGTYQRIKSAILHASHQLGA